eukprot:TRINITY_DN65931_c0_g1_i1.p1 TRINITY_DN65931_c0_g1~~TRINITY_DN65931_c0_g1_i1.p1  ORF type:complete len:357 (+),score=60.17 TRINITY_DN65931_c0_g1_i1:119-1072(+)
MQLYEWDITRTDELIADFEAWQASAHLEETLRQSEAMHAVDVEFEQAQAFHVAAQGRLARAKASWRRRVEEYDLLEAEGSHEDFMRRARQVCEVSEEELASAESSAWSAQSSLDAARAQRLRIAEACSVELEQENLARRQVRVRDLNDVLLRDIGDRIAHAEKWPLVIDPSDCAAKLLQYSGCAVLNFWRPGELTANKIRVAILSMIKGGGTLAIDLFAVAAGTGREILAEPFDDVRPGLFDDLLDRSLLKAKASDLWPSFYSLVDEARDGKRFSFEQFAENNICKFKMMLITSTLNPHADLTNLFDVIEVVPGGFD